MDPEVTPRPRFAVAAGVAVTAAVGTGVEIGEAVPAALGWIVGDPWVVAAGDAVGAFEALQAASKTDAGTLISSVTRRLGRGAEINCASIESLPYVAGTMPARRGAHQPLSPAPAAVNYERPARTG